MTRCAILVSHPIQYLVPLFQALSEHETISTEIWCNNDFGNKPFFDPDFKKTIKWDIEVVEGYTQRLLKNISFRPSTNFFGQINPKIHYSPAMHNVQDKPKNMLYKFVKVMKILLFLNNLYF